MTTLVKECVAGMTGLSPFLLFVAASLYAVPARAEHAQNPFYHINPVPSIDTAPDYIDQALNCLVIYQVDSA